MRLLRTIAILLLSALLLAPFAYVGAYYVVVQKGHAYFRHAQGKAIYSPEFPNESLAKFFQPVYEIDRFLREDYWDVHERDMFQIAR